jgi:DNA polymerase (family 10)
MDNKDIARILHEMAALMELRQENRFKIRAYRNAARSMERLNEPAAKLNKSGRLREIPGVGSAIARDIEELLQTGKLKPYEKLKSGLPITLFELLRVPRLGPRQIRTLHEQLGISDLQDLEKACRENRLLTLKGFGPKTQQRILEGIESARRSRGRLRLNRARPLAVEMLEFLQRCGSVDRAEIAGSVRRWREIVNNVDLVASFRKPEEALDDFSRLPFIASLMNRQKDRITLRLQTLDVDARLVVVKPAQFQAALHYYTGSKQYNEKMFDFASKRGFKMEADGIFRKGKAVAIKTEEELFELLECDFIPPELREDTGEIEAAFAHQLPALIEQRDLKGVFHVHSTWSDGQHTLEEMVAAAAQRGYEYVGISEHSKSAYYAHGLDEQRLAKLSVEIDRLQKKYKCIRILKGSEVDILPDGTLDYFDAVLRKLDFVVASVHSRFSMPEREMTQRICRALSNSHVDILGHATGRLLMRRKGYDVNLEEVLQTALRHRKCIEVNANPWRLDLEWKWIKRAKELGVKFAINPDAHYTYEFDNMMWGIANARKGWASASDVINTLPWSEAKAFFQLQRTQR